MSPKRHLDSHCLAIMEEYKEKLPLFQQMSAEIQDLLNKLICGTGKVCSVLDNRLKVKDFSGAGIHVASIESRVKEEDSLAGKLERKGQKYKTLEDITDIIGLRVITFYLDDVEKVASAIEKIFEVDWENSVDKRKLLEIDSFGYMSLHYICRLQDFPYRFEIQLRTALQHAWANMDHDTGYKSGVEIPVRYKRAMNRLAGMLELIDEEFSRMRIEITNYRRSVQNLVASGRLEEVKLDGDTFRSYMYLQPFRSLNRRIASVNQAEIQDTSLMPYLPIFKALGCKTLGDIDKLIDEYSEPAYQIACYQMGMTDLDVISESLGPQNLCIAFILKNGGGKVGLRYLYENLNGTKKGADTWADLIMEQAKDLPFMNLK